MIDGMLPTSSRISAITAMMPTMMAAIASVMLTRNPGGSPWRNATTTLATSERLAPLLPPDRIVIGESGIFTPSDLARLAKIGIGAFLVGESLMRQTDVAAATRALLARRAALAQ